MATLDTGKLRKPHRLMDHGATEGERAAARSRADTMAKAAGLMLAEALSMLDTHTDLSEREIARRVGVSPQTVSTWRRKAEGVPPRRRTPSDQRPIRKE